jgi:hypothetical protein
MNRIQKLGVYLQNLQKGLDRGLNWKKQRGLCEKWLEFVFAGELLF